LTAGAEASSIPAMATTRDARHMGLETPATAITPTESAVLNLLAQGLDNRQIAERLGTHPDTLGRLMGHLKTEQNGEMCPAIGLNSEAVIDQWLWNRAGRNAVMREFYRIRCPARAA